MYRANYSQYNVQSIMYVGTVYVFECPSLHLYRCSISKLIAQQFPLMSTEFTAGSPQYNEYISVIDKVLLTVLY